MHLNLNKQLSVIILSSLHVHVNVLNEIITPADLTALGYVISTTSHPFRKVHISRCGLTDDNLTVLVMGISIDKLKNLGIWHLTDDNISSNGARILARALKPCYKLEELELSRNDIGSDGAKALSSVLKSCDRLEKLDLSDNNIGPDGAQVLASMVRSSKNMEVLDVSNNNIGHDGVIAFPVYSICVID